jgi:transposase InsO family protein
MHLRLRQRRRREFLRLADQGPPPSPRAPHTCQARTAVFDSIETFYNRLRLHSTLEYLSPVDDEKMKEEEEQQAA